MSTFGMLLASGAVLSDGARSSALDSRWVSNKGRVVTGQNGTLIRQLRQLDALYANKKGRGTLVQRAYGMRHPSACWPSWAVLNGLGAIRWTA